MCGIWALSKDGEDARGLGRKRRTHQARQGMLAWMDAEGRCAVRNDRTRSGEDRQLGWSSSSKVMHLKGEPTNNFTGPAEFPAAFSILYPQITMTLYIKEPSLWNRWRL